MTVDTREGPRLGDAFGAMLLACLEAGAEPGRVRETVERDDGYIDGRDAVAYFQRYQEWDALDRWLAERAAGRVLDVGAGAGRAALYLQDSGQEVTALDVSPLALEVLRRRGIRQVFAGTVFDLACGFVGPPYDRVLLLGNNLGLLENRQQAPLVLGTLASVTGPRAAILGRGTDPYATENPLHLGYHARNRALGRMGGQLRIRVRYEDMATPYFDYLLAAPDELCALLSDTPWALAECEREGGQYAAVLVKQ